MRFIKDWVRRYPLNAHQTKHTILVLLIAQIVSACGGGSSAGTAIDVSATANVPSVGAAVAGTESNATALDVGAAVVMPDSGPLVFLSDAEFNQLTAIDRYKIANRVAATFYTGVPVDEFLDPAVAFSRLLPTVSDNFLSDYQQRLQMLLSAEQRVQVDLSILGTDELDTDIGLTVEPKYRFDHERAAQLPLARIYEYPVSFDQLSQWMAWHLSNTILFSPSAELESAGMTDVQNIMRRLDKAILANESIQQIVFDHMRSQENWRRFRSPEDNTREMMEIYLGFEELDNEVPAASKACQDLYLTDDNDGYQLAYTDFPNGEAQTVLGQTIITCDDFYRVVANHENLLPIMARVLVGYFFSTRDRGFQQQAIEQLIAMEPHGFRELFLPIVFSRAYLMETEKPRSFEENFLSMAKRLRWQPHEDLFRGLVSGRGGLHRTHQQEMGWPAMTSKLGRPPTVPLDSLSFANYHKALREELLLDSYRWQFALGIREPDPPDPTPLTPPPEGATQQAITDYQTVLNNNQQIIDAMSESDRTQYLEDVQQYQRHQFRHEQVVRYNLPEFIDYLFLSVAMRKALPVETETLIGLFDQQDWLRIEVEGQYLNRWNRVDAARLTLDYLSRLPEVYYHQRFQES